MDLLEGRPEGLDELTQALGCDFDPNHSTVEIHVSAAEQILYYIEALEFEVEAFNKGYVRRGVA